MMACGLLDAEGVARHSVAEAADAAETILASSALAVATDFGVAALRWRSIWRRVCTVGAGIEMFGITRRSALRGRRLRAWRWRRRSVMRLETRSCWAS